MAVSVGNGCLQIYPMANPQRCPRALEPGSKTAARSTITMGADQVGMVGCPLMMTYGLVLWWRIASTPSRRKPQILSSE